MFSIDSLQFLSDKKGTIENSSAQPHIPIIPGGNFSLFPHVYTLLHAVKRIREFRKNRLILVFSRTKFVQPFIGNFDMPK